MNKCVLVGRMTKDPDLRFAAGSGTAVCRFTLAVNRRKKEDGADFINCVSFGKTGETIAQYFTKGKQIAVSGHIQTGSYDAQDGTKRYSTDVAVESFDFIGDSKGDTPSNGTSQFEGGFNEDITPVNDSEMPFN